MAKIKLDHLGIAQVLASADVANALAGLGESVAAHTHAESHDGPVPVEVTDGHLRFKRDPIARAAASVTLAHAAGLAIEAKHGTLARAAAAAGLEVRGGA